MTEPFDPGADNPYAPAALKRRSQIATPQATTAEDPYADNWVAQTARSQVQRVGNYAPALGGLGRQLLGDQEGANKDYAEFAKGEETARALGPEVQTFDDAKKAGGGVGNYLSAIGYQGAAFVPDVALAATGAGLGADAAGAVAKGAIRRSIADVIENRAVNVAAREEATRLAVRKAAVEAPDGAAAVSNAIRVAQAQVRETGKKAAMDEAVRIAGRTPRFTATVDNARRLAGTAGGAAGFYPATVSGSVDFLSQHPGQEAAAKVAGVDAAASLVGSLPFGHGLDGVFKFLSPEAKKLAEGEIAKSAQRFLPKLAKDTALHAAGGGAAGGLMTATQLAGHHWVDNNLDLLSDDAKSQYLDSFVGGALAGGVFHAGPVAVGRAGEALRGKVGDKAGAFKTFATDTLRKYADKVRELHAKKDAEGPQPGDELGPGGPDAPGAPIGDTPSGLADLFRRGRDAASGIAGKATEMGTAAVDRVKKFTDAIHHDEDIGSRVDSLYNEFKDNGEKIPGRLRSADQNPITGLGGLRDEVMSFLPKDSPVWMDKSTASYVASSLERLITGKEPTAKDAKVHTALVDSGALSQHTIDAMRLVGEQYGEVLHHVGGAREAAKTEDAAPAENGVIAPDLAAEIKARMKGEPAPDEMRDNSDEAQRQVEGEGDVVNDTMSEGGRDALATNATKGEAVANAFVAARDAGRRVREAKTDEAKAAAIADRRAANKTYLKARGELRSHLYGEVTPTTRFGKNVFYESSNKPEAKAKFAETMAQPGRVEIDPIDVGRTKPIMARAGLSIDSLAAKEIGQNSEAYQNLEPAQRGKAAFIRVLGDLAQAGIKVKPESITAGDLGKVNGIYLGALTEGDVKDLRGLVRSGVGRNAEHLSTKGVHPFADGQKALRPGGSPGTNPKGDRSGNLIEPSARDRVQGTEELADQDLHKLAPREEPTGRRSKQGDFVPDEGVSAVTLKPSGFAAEHARGLLTRKATARVTRVAYRSSAAKAEARKLKHLTPREARVEAAAKLAGKVEISNRIDKGVDSHPITKRSDPRFEAGVEIGERQLRAEHEVHGNDRRLAQSLDRLRDPESGMAARFYADALKGKFDTGRVTEKKADHEKIDRKAAAEEPAPGEKAASKKPETEALKRELNTADAAAEAAAKAKALDRQSNPPAKPEGKVLKASELLHADEAGVESMTKAEGPHDHKAETKMLNGILERMGIASRVRVIPLRPKTGPQNGGEYSARHLTVAINDNLHGAERVEVLLHELGHHIIYDALAKEMGVEHTRMARITSEQALDMLAKSNPELHKAMVADYAAWRTEQLNSNWRTIDVRASRAPLFRGRGLRERGAYDSQRIGSKSPAGRENLLDAHEWMADHIARALAGKHESQSIIGKFFSTIAEKLRAAYETIFGNPDLAKLKPAESVDKWVQSLFDANVEAVREATGASVPAKAAEATVQAAAAVEAMERFDPNVDMISEKFLKQFGEFYRTVVPLEARQIVDRVLSRASSIKVLQEMNKGNSITLPMLSDAARGMENRAAFAYIAWKTGKLRTGTEGNEVFARIGDNLAKVFGATGEGDLAQRVFSDIASGAVQRFHDANKTYSVRELEARKRGNVQRALNWVNKRGKAGEAVSKFLEGSKSRLWGAGVPAMREFVTRIQRPQGTTRDDLLGPKDLPAGEGMTPAIVHTLARFEKSTRDALGHLSRKQQVTVLDMLQRQMTPEHPKWAIKSQAARDAVTAVRKIMDEAYVYLKQAGVKDLGRRENFFPVVIDLRNEAAKQNLFDLYNQPEKFEGPIREFFGKTTEEESVKSREADTETPFEELVQKLVNGAVEEHGFTAVTGSDAPNFRGMNHRVSQFVYDYGDAKDVRAFANLQSKNAADVMSRYLGPMVKRAEYARHFGPNGEIKERLFADMRKQGATEDQITEADNVLKASLGTYGAEGSPVLGMLSKDLAKKLHTKATRDVVSGLQAYQNTRLLPLALLSSLVDPMGIAVRTGGDFALAWHGFKGGMKALTDKATRDELHGMLEQLGAVDDTLFVLQSGFGGSADRTWPNRINEWVFRYNLMEAWVTNTRLQALLTAHGFLLKHGDGKATKNSQRYMQELQLKDGDVRSEIQQRPDGKQVQRVLLLTEAQRKAASSEEVARDDRVRNALRAFIDDAILRPNSTQRPLWHNDPYMGLITQYKAFGYAIYDQIAGRINHEIQHGNLKVLNAALAYVPIVILSEMIRGVLQYGFGGNPNRDDWGPEDYLMMGVQRSGLPGPTVNLAHDIKGDLDRKNLPGKSQLGPTLGQLGNAADAFEGRRDLGKEFEAALPLSAGTQHWDDESTTDTNQKAA
jgi:hypothetical protein